MRSFLLFSLLSASATLAKEVHLPIPPIYIGDVFLPPSMYILAWTAPRPSSEFVYPPSSKNTTVSLSSSSPSIPSPEWCRTAVEVTENEPFSVTHPDAKNGVLEGLKFVGYFASEKEGAHLERDGKLWGKCYITPESGKIGSCDGLGGGDRWDGWGTRTWSCWAVVDEVVMGAEEEENKEAEKKEEIVGTEEQRVQGILSGSLGRSVEGIRRAEKTLGVRGSEVLEAFTAVMTGFSG
ncbi:hypothetical protein ACMFMF_009805 [Clarireedia jacksonii]